MEFCQSEKVGTLFPVPVTVKLVIHGHPTILLVDTLLYQNTWTPNMGFPFTGWMSTYDKLYTSWGSFNWCWRFVAMETTNMMIYFPVMNVRTTQT